MNNNTNNTIVNTQSQKEADADELEELARILSGLSAEQKNGICCFAMGVKSEGERNAFADRAAG